MANQFINKTIENSSGAVANAWRAKQLVVNLDQNRAHVKEGGWKNGQYIADQKGEAAPPINWVEPDIDALVTTQEYPVGTKVADIVFDVVSARMLSLSENPDGSGPNPFQGGVMEDIPAPTE